MMMKYLHIFGQGNPVVTQDYYNLIKKNFSFEEHFFVINDDAARLMEDFKGLENIRVLSWGTRKGTQELLGLCGNCEKIILHSLCIRTAIILKILLNKTLLKKAYWVAWGMDLYQVGGSLRPKKAVSTYISNQFRKHIHNFVGIFPPDIDYFRQHFNTHAKTFYANYAGGLRNLPDNLSRDEDDTDVHILIGHQANPILHHVETLEILRKFSGENVKIFIPLSYGGDDEYIEKVERKAKELFGAKAFLLKQKLPFHEYMNLLYNIDIFMFNTNRQIGLGNIYAAMRWGKKLFMPKDSPMYHYFVSQGIEICRIEDIAGMGFEQMCRPVNMDKAVRYLEKNITDVNVIAGRWQNVFDS